MTIFNPYLILNIYKYSGEGVIVVQSPYLKIYMEENSQKIINRGHQYCLLLHVFASLTDKLVAIQVRNSIFDAEK